MKNSEKVEMGLLLADAIFALLTMLSLLFFGTSTIFLVSVGILFLVNTAMIVTSIIKKIFWEVPVFSIISIVLVVLLVVTI